MNIINVKNLSKEFVLPHSSAKSLKELIIHPTLIKKGRGEEVQKALDNISFEVKEGDFFGIVGKNGSGKSTLLKILAGVYLPSNGTINVKGSLTPFIELGVGFNAELSGRDNVYLNGALLGFSRKQMNEKYDEIVEFAELEKFMDQKLKNYSSGMQVRLAFSIAIQAKSDILLLDEVLAVGDAAFQQKCYSYFEELKKSNTTVVFVSHDMDTVRRFCDRAIYIKEGSLIEQGDVNKIVTTYTKENIENSNKTLDQSDKLKLLNDYHVKGKVSTNVNNKVALTIEYNCAAKDKEPVFIGISISKDNLSVAEITTENELNISRSGKFTYSIDKNMFNSGVYSISGGVFIKKDRKLVAAFNERKTFVVENDSLGRGGPLKLPSGWKQRAVTK